MRNYLFAALAIIALVGLAPRAEAALDDKAFLVLCASGTAREVEDAVKAGANVSARGTEVDLELETLRSEWPLTALMFAAWHNKYPEVITVLVKGGADVNAKNEWNLTALMYAAAINNNPEVVIALLKAGADAKARDNDGKTAVDYAAGNETLKDTDAYRELKDASN